MNESVNTWSCRGFRGKPRYVKESKTSLILYRIWSDPNREMGDRSSEGVFLTSKRPGGKKEAEALLAIFEYGNAASHVTQIRLSPGASFYEGEVDPGDHRAVLGNSYGSQVWISQEQFQRFAHKHAAAEKLHDDLNGKVVVTTRTHPRN